MHSNKYIYFYHLKKINLDFWIIPVFQGLFKSLSFTSLKKERRLKGILGDINADGTQASSLKHQSASV